MIKEKWLSVPEYAKKYGVNKSSVYMKIYMRKLPRKVWKHELVLVKKYQLIDKPIEGLK